MVDLVIAGIAAGLAGLAWVYDHRVPKEPRR
jgi:hypothetical protein